MCLQHPHVPRAPVLAGEAGKAAAAAAERRLQGAQAADGGFIPEASHPQQGVPGPVDGAGGSGAITASPHGSTPDVTPQMSPLVSPRSSLANPADLDDMSHSRCSSGPIPGMRQYDDPEVGCP